MGLEVLVCLERWMRGDARGRVFGYLSVDHTSRAENFLSETKSKFEAFYHAKIVINRPPERKYSMLTLRAGAGAGLCDGHVLRALGIQLRRPKVGEGKAR